MWPGLYIGPGTEYKTVQTGTCSEPVRIRIGIPIPVRPFTSHYLINISRFPNIILLFTSGLWLPLTRLPTGQHMARPRDSTLYVEFH